MDGTRFDSLIRTLRSLADRRTTVRALSAAAIGALACPGTADAKKKRKKCKGGKKSAARSAARAGSSAATANAASAPRPCRLPVRGMRGNPVRRAVLRGARNLRGQPCVPCPQMANSCDVAVPRCSNGAGVCATWVEGGTFCVGRPRVPPVRRRQRLRYCRRLCHLRHVHQLRRDQQGVLPAAPRIARKAVLFPRQHQPANQREPPLAPQSVPLRAFPCPRSGRTCHGPVSPTPTPIRNIYVTNRSCCGSRRRTGWRWGRTRG